MPAQGLDPTGLRLGSITPVRVFRFIAVAATGALLVGSCSSADGTSEPVTITTEAQVTTEPSPTATTPTTAAAATSEAIRCLAFLEAFLSVADQMSGDLFDRATVVADGFEEGFFSADESGVLFQAISDDFADLRDELGSLGESPPSLAVSVALWQEAMNVYVDVYRTLAVEARSSGVGVIESAREGIARGNELVGEANAALAALEQC